MLIIGKYLPRYVERRVETTLEQRYDSTVQFGSLAISVYPMLRLTGTNLVLRHNGFVGVPPLIQARQFSAETGFWELIRRTHHLSRVQVDGLTITVPPRRSKRQQPPGPRRKVHRYPAVVDTLVADNARLVIMPEDPRRPPKIFVIHRLVLKDAGMGQAMGFNANLVNPQPRGEIISIGTFGPWNTDDPALTPLNASYKFLHADLGTIHGLSGTLSSEGEFSGRLNRIEVTGETTTPDFKLSVSGTAVPLKTEFHAVVDGTNGNTFLEPVHAQVVGSAFTAKGGVFVKPGQKHRTIELEVSASGDHLEDLLRLAVKSRTPPMTGLIDFRAKLIIPPGNGDVLDRLKLSGSFELSKGAFSALNVEEKVNDLSHHGLGKPRASDAGNTLSNLRGRFSLSNAVMSFPGVTFSVPGASIHLAGKSDLHTQTLDFAGTIALRAEVSQMTTGWKSILLRPLDPLFRRGKMGTVLPITVTGTESKPDFGVQIRRALLRR
ncbi:MAG: AsmA-like C-terminal region-containing protein [Terriglobia bacterium]